MAQNKTSLILNNLVELSLPISSVKVVKCKYRNADSSLADESLFFSIELPAPFLLQKVHLEIADKYTVDDFLQAVQTFGVLRRGMTDTDECS